MSLSQEQLKYAREWIAECADAGVFRDLEACDVDDLTDAEIERAIERHFGGGLEAFKEAA